MARLSVPIPENLHKRMNKLFPWGTQAQAVRSLLEILCEKIEKDGVIVIALLIDKQYNPMNTIEHRGKLS